VFEYLKSGYLVRVFAISRESNAAKKVNMMLQNSPSTKSDSPLFVVFLEISTGDISPGN